MFWNKVLQDGELYRTSKSTIFTEEFYIVCVSTRVWESVFLRHFHLLFVPHIYLFYFVQLISLWKQSWSQKWIDEAKNRNLMTCDRNLPTCDAKLPTNVIARRQLMMKKTHSRPVAIEIGLSKLKKLEKLVFSIKLNGLSEC